ncbi:hypothetical protein [Streptomyces sp. NBC_00503]|uniref:hypothetical protein n=1 Tax=Streptomyces sp. NBC_00503 TaxID=2903659 RepID=UPI002E8117A2|nr:hypothetical protein [Streptomyces sp. NBC_00503]WUD79169.1 hypothetical protein OG490_00410 [Streptomyces sp. NBC_00503]
MSMKARPRTSGPSASGTRGDSPFRPGEQAPVGEPGQVGDDPQFAPAQRGRDRRQVARDAELRLACEHGVQASRPVGWVVTVASMAGEHVVQELTDRRHLDAIRAGPEAGWSAGR